MVRTDDVQCDELGGKVSVFPGCGNLSMPRGLWLWDLVCRTHFLLMAPWVKPAIRAKSTCCRLSLGSLPMSCNILLEIWRDIVWTLQNRDQKVVSNDGIWVKLTTLILSGDLPPWLLMNLLIQSCMKCIWRTILYQRPFRPLPEIGAACFEINHSHTIHFAVSKTKISHQRKYIPMNWPPVYRVCILDKYMGSMDAKITITQLAAVLEMP